MKAIIRIGATIEGPAELSKERLSAFAVRQLAEGFSKRREDFQDGLMVVEEGSDKSSVFMVLSSRPPEIITGQRQVHAVFWPPESQEPIATFFEELDAEQWAQSKYGDHPEGYVIRPIDSTDRINIQVSVSTMLWRGGDLLFCRIKGTNDWTFPESTIGVGESINAAAQRGCLKGTGIEVQNVHIPARVPYVNVYLRHAAQHFLTLIMYAEYKEGEPVPLDDTYSHVKWFPASAPPDPLFATVKGAMAILDKYGKEAVAEAE